MSRQELSKSPQAFIIFLMLHFQNVVPTAEKGEDTVLVFSQRFGGPPSLEDTVQSWRGKESSIKGGGTLVRRAIKRV